MPRLIDADELMRTLGITDMDCNICAWGENQYCTRGGDFEDACRAIEDAPTIEERKKGKWIPFDNPLYKCSECGAVRENKSFMENFCPNCGADMRENDGETEGH